MNKTYIMNMALQGKGRFDSALYAPVGFELSDNIETHFPILPIIKDDWEEGDQVRLIVVRADNDDTAYNTEILRTEVKNMGIPVDEDNIRELKLKEVKRDSDYSRMILDVLEEIPENGTVSIDVTYGTKPESFMIYYAAMVAENSKTDVELDGIYYGQIVRENYKTVGAYLHKLNMMKALLDMAVSMKAFGYSDIENIMKHMTEE